MLIFGGDDAVETIVLSPLTVSRGIARVTVWGDTKYHIQKSQIY